MPSSHDRREFLRRALLAGTALPFPGILLGEEESERDRKRRERREKRKEAAKDPASERLNLGVIAVGGRGGENLAEVSSQNIVAICDIDRNHLEAARAKHPDAKAYADYRRVLDHTDLDGVVISTPDHMHAIVAVAALKAGLDVYCEKPLAHSVREVRVMRELAAGKERVTQMGTQIHAGENYRRVVEILQSGILGKIPRVHVWQETRPIPGKRVAEGSPPGHIDYDLWLGPAPYRPFHPSHFHFNWRFWFDFGGGAFADMACHYLDLPHWALGIRDPLTIEARGEKDYEGDNDVPGKLRVDYRYGAPAEGIGQGTPVHLTYYQGGLRPEGAEVYERGSAVLFEGEKGRLVADYGSHRYYFDDKRDDPPAPPKSIPPSPGHQREWIEAVRSRAVTSCNFDYSGALAEAVLLGNVAYRAGEKIEWEARAARITNAPGAARFLEREYRKGWSL